MEHFIQTWGGEFLSGIVLLVLAVAFNRWANKLDVLRSDVLQKLASLGSVLAEMKKEFHEHELRTERRVTSVETELRAVRRELENQK